MRQGVLCLVIVQLLFVSWPAVGQTSFSVPPLPAETLASAEALKGTPGIGFDPLPAPSAAPSIPGVHPASNPLNPPAVDDTGVVPDFSAAWAAAYDRARSDVRRADFLFYVSHI